MSDWTEITRQILDERGASRFYSNVLFRETVGSSNEWVRELPMSRPRERAGLAAPGSALPGRIVIFLSSSARNLPRNTPPR